MGHQDDHHKYCHEGAAFDMMLPLQVRKDTQPRLPPVLNPAEVWFAPLVVLYPKSDSV
jgi:hypothetical protein